ncbi:hypothetical protein GON03_03985 [Nocardioides sp. MAH-18]|uniref:Uncharacterized protein n=1 Tax=Nocardioides agri TaxID=2682843 RepID=A0A6L6XN06_9ACTN|nr:MULTISPECIES: hypothetical protein [unclassified Nocardioides]MBA2953460.1 hypothetical protein [Nocardioides sp. CGMCC 1.13656]MVQ48328.1 hypothetical protein [Nocardioides sp. MAH-18]
MSQPPPSYPVPSGYPPGQPPRPQKYRPSWVWFLAGGALIVLAGLIGVALFVWALWPFFSTDARVPADGRPHVVSVDTDGDRMLWRDDDVFDPGCRVVDTATGEEIPLRPVTSQMTRDLGDGEFVASYRFSPGSGELEVTCAAGVEADPDDATDPDWRMGWGEEVVIGPAPNVGGMVAAMATGVIVPGLLGLAGLAMLVVTGVLWASRPARPRT